MEKRKICIVSLGKSPSTSIVRDVFGGIEKNYSVSEVGILDKVSFSELKEVIHENDEHPLVAGIQDKYLILLSRKKLAPLAKKILDEVCAFDQKVLFLCSDIFMESLSSDEVIHPGKLLRDAVKSARPSSATVIIPDPAQERVAEEKWFDLVPNLKFFVKPLNKFAIDNIPHDNIIMDCVGYSIKMEEAIKFRLGTQVFGARSVIRKELIRIAREDE